MKTVYEQIAGKLESLAATKTTCDGCSAVIGERYAHWPAHTVTLAMDPKQKGKIQAHDLEAKTKKGDKVESGPSEYVPTREFHFCSEDCMRGYLNKRGK